MILTLNNFKQYKNYRLELPESGLVLIKGHSGSGKTSIFQGIFDAITGEADNVHPWDGSKPTTVTLEIPGKMLITRKHSPESLYVVIGDKEYHDDAAQKMIYRVMDTSLPEFMATYYIQQRLSGSLLTMTQANQLRFIQKLAFGEQDPEVYKKRISSLIDKRKELLNNQTAACSLIETNLKTKAGLIATKEEGIISPSWEGNIPNKTELGSLHSQKTKLLKRLKEIGTLFANPLIDAKEKYLLEKDNITNMILDIDQQIQRYMENTLEHDTTSLKQRIKTCNDKIKYLEWKKSVDDITLSIKKELGNFSGSAGVFLSDTINQLQKSISNNATIITQKQENINNNKALLKSQTTILHCPQCSTDLIHSHGILEEYSGEEIDTAKIQRMIDNDVNALKELNKEKVDLQHRYQTAYSRMQQVTSLKDRAIKDPDSSIRSLTEANDIIVQTTKEIENAITLNANIKKDKESADKLVLSKASKLKQLELLKSKADEAEMKQIPSKDQLLTEQKDINDQLFTVDREILLLSEVVDNYNTYLSDLMVFEEKRKQIKELQEEHDKLSILFKEKSVEWTSINNNLAAAIRLKEISDAAAISATESIINSINQGAQVMSRLLPNEGTSVKILSGFKTKKGDDRSKLSLEVIHKGHNIGKDINACSGGEKDRIIVAFQLSMADLYNASFIMLDEPFAGCDTDQTLNNCLELLKDSSRNKLILVAQHGAPLGIFDQVIEI